MKNKISIPDDDGLLFTSKWEGFVPHWYRDIANVWTCMYGHAFRGGDVVDSSLTFTEEEGRKQLLVDMQRCTAPLLWLLEEFPDLEDPAFLNALADWLFNCGPGALGTTTSPSTVLHYIMTGELARVPEGLALWCKVKDPKTGQKVTNQGLLNRRVAEGKMWNRAGKVYTPEHFDATEHPRGLEIVIPDEEALRRGVFPLWELTGDILDAERRADLERRNREAGF